MRHLSLALLLLGFAAPAARAEPPAPLHLKVGAHIIDEVRLPEAMPKLLMDGKVLVDDAMSFTLKLQHTVNGVPSAIIYADRSGGSCNDGTSLFIDATMSDAGGVKGVPVASCWSEPKYMQALDSDGEVLLEQQDPGLAFDGDLWRFVPGKGLSKVANLTYTPMPGTTWADLRRQAGTGAPVELFRNEAFAKDFDRGTGMARATILPAAGDAADPNGTIQGRFLIAEGFQAHDGRHQALIAVDLVAQRVFVADYPGDAPIAVYPAVHDWPSPARKKLALWAKQVVQP